MAYSPEVWAYADEIVMMTITILIYFSKLRIFNIFTYSTFYDQGFILLFNKLKFVGFNFDYKTKDFSV